MIQNKSEIKSQPSIDSLRDIIDEFPLSDGNGILIKDTVHPDHLILPFAIEPASDCKYKVLSKLFEIAHEQRNGPILIRRSYYKKESIPFCEFKERVIKGTVIESGNFKKEPVR